jgi:hypothetical protein
MRLILTCALTWALGSAGLAGEAAFSSKPAVTKDGDKVKIAFTVAAPTDVEVAVLDSAGKVVRHRRPACSARRIPRPSR